MNIENTVNINNLETLTNELTIKRKELENIIDTRIKGCIIRSKSQYVEHNEKNSKYFSNLEKKQSEKKIIKSLRQNGNKITDIQKIMQMQSSFYTNLYKKRVIKDSSYNFFNNSINKISEHEKNKCEGNLTEYECGLSLKDMKNNKSPGSDGITTEFYKLFWNDIKTYLINSLNYSLQNGELTELQK